MKATLTVTFHGPKVGLWINPGKSHAGGVEVVEIGIPRDGARPPEAGLIAPGVLDVVPRRTGDATKFSSGSVLVVGGSTGLTGAVCMACEGSMRAGAGWVRAAVPASLNADLRGEAHGGDVRPAPRRRRTPAEESGGQVLEAAERADSVVLGPGLGRTPEAFALAQLLIERIERPLLIDADGLNALAEGGLERAAARESPTVLTPHAGELARLLGIASGEVSAHRLRSVRQAASRSGAVVVLKGDDTLVAAPTSLAVSKGGSPGLATAGTGDVLSGITGAFLARRVEPFDAACAAVKAHADAGREVEARWEQTR